MILAKVTGHVVATQKCDELRGSNLLLITQLDDNQQLMKDRSWVAVDSVGAGVHDDAPRDKCTLSCAINGIHAAFHYLKKNYISGCVMTVPTG
ncbi:EutN/CcmL family microcompartment protein [Escherichia coli]|nr:ethanolamine utilization protein EutN/carboxysome structural protein CcmL [Escherichia coli HVH 28 (4-0907367)]